MPRLPPVTRTMPSAVMAVALIGCTEQPTRNQLLIGRDDMVRHGDNGAAGVGITTAEIAARPHQYVDYGFELFVAEIVDRTGLAGTPKNADIGGRDIVEMFLVADRREMLGLVEDAQKFRHLADEIEEGTKTLD